jgi:uncharacterized membrane protein YkvA (DUF1232 family)
VARRLSGQASGDQEPCLTVTIGHGTNVTLENMIRLLLIAGSILAVSWLILLVLAARLPDGVAKDLASFLPSCVKMLRTLRTDPRVPRRAKLAIGFAALWAISPIDLIPEFLPVIGPLDDIVVIALALRYAGRQVPRDVILEAWSGNPSLINRLLGPVPATAERSA